jgi:hypothetical protein
MLISMKEPEPDIGQGADSPFIRFAKTRRGLIAVSKREVEDKVAEEKAHRKAQRRREYKGG